MLINVTKFHIAKGDVDCERCPIALALLEHEGIRSAYIDYTDTKINGESVSLPDEAKLFMDRFDDDWEVRPFSFELDYTP